jgi:hypothetical protein
MYEISYYKTSFLKLLPLPRVTAEYRVQTTSSSTPPRPSQLSIYKSLFPRRCYSSPLSGGVALARVPWQSKGSHDRYYQTLPPPADDEVLQADTKSSAQVESDSASVRPILVYIEELHDLYNPISLDVDGCITLPLSRTCPSPCATRLNGPSQASF